MKKITKDCFNAYGLFQQHLYVILNNDNSKLVSHIYHWKIDCNYNLNINKLKKELNELGIESIQTNDDDVSWTQHLSDQTGNCVITFNSFYIGSDQANITLTYSEHYDKNELEKIKTHLLKYKKKIDKRNNQVNFITKTSEGIALLQKSIQTAKVDLDNYNLSIPLERIKEAINEKKSGLIVFSGDPGTGKTYLIKHLINTMNKQFVFVPTNVADILTDPSFMMFAMDKLSDSILIIEDAELALVDRQKSVNNTASTLLNITDGILGELLNIKVLATVNVEETIDSALLRKGRLLCKANFGKLQPEQANRILERLGKETKVEKECTLAELYNSETITGHEQKQIKKIGF